MKRPPTLVYILNYMIYESGALSIAILFSIKLKSSGTYYFKNAGCAINVGTVNDQWKIGKCKLEIFIARPKYMIYVF